MLRGTIIGRHGIDRVHYQVRPDVVVTGQQPASPPSSPDAANETVLNGSSPKCVTSFSNVVSSKSEATTFSLLDVVMKTFFPSSLTHVSNPKPWSGQKFMQYVRMLRTWICYCCAESIGEVLGWYTYERIVSGEVFFAKQAGLDLRARCPIVWVSIAFVYSAALVMVWLRRCFC